MTSFRPLTVRGQPLGKSGEAAVCLPLMAPDSSRLDSELQTLLALSPDVIEWRVDHFAADTIDSVMVAASRLRREAGATPLIFTLRSEVEGGAKFSLDTRNAVPLMIRAAESSCFEFIDVELSLPSDVAQNIIDTAHQNDVQVIGSSHHFSETPSEESIVATLSNAAKIGADVAKIAVMPKVISDVVTLLAATERASRELRIPLITMAMGSLGVVTRVFGGMFGSALTFAAGTKTSAPGQLPIETLREILDAARSKRTD